MIKRAGNTMYIICLAQSSPLTALPRGSAFGTYHTFVTLGATSPSEFA